MFGKDDKKSEPKKEAPKAPEVRKGFLLIHHDNFDAAAIAGIRQLFPDYHHRSNFGAFWKIVGESPQFDVLKDKEEPPQYKVKFSSDKKTLGNVLEVKRA